MKFPPFALAILTTVMGTHAQATWQQTYPAFGFEQLNDVIWDGSRYLAVGDCGAIATSPDAQTWSFIRTGGRDNLVAVAYNGTRYVAVGETEDFGDPSILSSTDAITWDRHAPPGDGNLSAVIWNSNEFLAVGARGTVVSSTGGTVWEERPTPGVSTWLRGLVWDGAQYLFVGTNSTSYTSVDGADLVFHATDVGFSRPSFTAIATNGTRHVGVGASGMVQYTPDGITWTSAGRPTFASLNDITWTGDRFIAAGSNQTTSAALAVSLDGETWTNHSVSTGGTSLFGVTSGPHGHVAVGHTIFHSPDAMAWSQVAGPVQPFLNGFAGTGDTRVAVGQSGTILTSKNSGPWNPVSSGTSLPLSSVAASEDTFIAVGYSGTLLSSSDGSTWQPVDVGTTNHLHDALWSGSQFLVVGSSGTLLTSDNGTVWQQHATGISSSLTCVAFSGAEYMLTSSSSIYRSTDGRQGWQQVYSKNPDSSVFLESITWAGNRWVAVDYNGGRLDSSNGLSWTYRSLDGAPLFDTASLGNTAYITGRDELILTPEASRNLYFGTQLRNYYATDQVLGEILIAGELGMIYNFSHGRLERLPAGNPFIGLSWYAGQLSGAGERGMVGTSTDGASWTTSSVFSRSWAKILDSELGKLAISDLGGLYRFDDTSGWQFIDRRCSTRVLGITYGDGRIIATCSGGVIAVSSDTLTWTCVKTPTDHDIFDATWTGTQYVACSAGGTLLTSDDATSWSVRSAPTSFDFNTITSSSGLIVALGIRHACSRDGITWQTADSFGVVNDAIWDGTRFIAVGGSHKDGTIHFSSDGHTWIKSFDGGCQAFTAVTRSPDHIFAAAPRGVFRAEKTPPSAAPAILLQPFDKVVPTGGTATLNVTTTGEQLSHLWFLGEAGDESTPLPGATSSEITTPPVDSTTTLWAKISNPHGTAKTRTVTLTPGTLYEVWAAGHGLGSTSASTAQPDADPDRDGNDNQTEFDDGTDPGDPASVLPRLTIKKNGLGTVNADPDLQVYPFGSTVTLSAVPDNSPPDTFLGWSGEASGASPSINVTIDKSLVITANFGPPLEGALDQSDLAFTSGGDAVWFPQTDTTNDEIDALQSGPIDHGEETYFETNIVGPGVLSFWWKASSDFSDYLEFYIDGTRHSRISGTADWRQANIEIAGGSHTVRWRYTKNPFTDSRDDAGWVDQVAFIASSPYAGWAAANNLSGDDALPSADPDGDLVPNALERVLLGDPNAADNPPLVDITQTGNSFGMTFQIDPELIGTEIRIEASSALAPGSWTTVATRHPQGIWDAEPDILMLQEPGLNRISMQYSASQPARWFRVAIDL